MKRWIRIAPVLAFGLGLVGCNNSGAASSAPTDVQQSTRQAVCDAQAKVLDVVGQVQASSLQSKADVIAQLQLLQGELNSQADSLQSKGQSAAATKVKDVADGAGRLATAINGTDPGAVVTAAAQVADAVRRVPGCPSSSPSA
ncbi:MAG TPA: hypothetical protein VF986_08345 [Actinomycetota bacterium]